MGDVGSMGRGTARAVEIRQAAGNYRAIVAEQKKARGQRKAHADAYHTVTYSRHRHRRFSRRTVCAGHLVFEPEGRGGGKDPLNLFSAVRTQAGGGYSAH